MPAALNMAVLPMTAREVAELVGGRVEGDADASLSAIASLEDAGPGDLTFAAEARYVARLPKCLASAAMVGSAVESAPMALIRVDDVQAALAKLLGALATPEDLPARGIHETAVVAPDAKVASDARVGPYVAVGAGARIESSAVLCAQIGRAHV